MTNATDHVENGMSWREAGDGTPVVFLHGLGGTRASWGPQLRALSGHHRCVAWDMPGYGRSEPIEPLTYPAIAARLVDLLDELAIARATLVGLSFGGMHALHTTLRHPDRVERLVLADTSPAFGIDGTTRDEWVRSRLDGIDRGGTPADSAELIIDGITATALTGEIRSEIIGAFDEISARGFRAAVECLPGHDVRDRLYTIDQPALVIVGELDRETPVEYSRMLADGLPNSELRVMPGVGHLTPSEAPDEFTALVSDFLAGQTTSNDAGATDHEGTPR